MSTRPSGPIERTVQGLVALLRETIANDRIASRHGFLQGRDARLKCLSVFLLILSALATRSVGVLAALYAVSVALALVSSIAPGFFLKRTLLFIPLFSLFIVLPAIFRVVTPGQPIAEFGLLGCTIAITRQGVDSATIAFMRVLVSVSLAILLVLTTRHSVLLKSLRLFGVPRLFVMTMGMAYRYIYLLLDIVHSTFIAVKSRVGFVRSTNAGQRIVGASAAGLWVRSYQLQTQVYSAMLSRGYTGEPRVLDDSRIRATDCVMLTAALAALVGTLWLNHCSR